MFQVAGAHKGNTAAVVVVENKGILKKVNLRQLHLDTLLSFPKAISRRTKLGIAPGICSRGKEK